MNIQAINDMIYFDMLKKKRRLMMTCDKYAFMCYLRDMRTEFVKNPSLYQNTVNSLLGFKRDFLPCVEI